jgi:SAM-dependent methyltransferase
MTASALRRLTHLVVPLGLRRPVGRFLYRVRTRTGERRELLLGRLPFLATRGWVYDRAYYAAADVRQSTMYARLAEALVRLRSPETAVDVGCGTGLMLTKLAENGVRVLGVEGSRAAIRQARKAIPVLRANLERGVPAVGRFDVCLCIEVAEHLRPKTAPVLIEGLTRLSDTVVFTAAPPGQAGTAHINLQPPSYWASLFGEQGFAWSPLRDELLAAIADIPRPRFIHRNLMVFERRRPATAS